MVSSQPLFSTFELQPTEFSGERSNRVAHTTTDSINYLYILIFLWIKFIRVFLIYTYINNVSLHNNYIVFKNAFKILKTNIVKRIIYNMKPFPRSFSNQKYNISNTKSAFKIWQWKLNERYKRKKKRNDNPQKPKKNLHLKCPSLYFITRKIYTYKIDIITILVASENINPTPVSTKQLQLKPIPIYWLQTNINFQFSTKNWRDKTRNLLKM